MIDRLYASNRLQQNLAGIPKPQPVSSNHSWGWFMIEFACWGCGKSLKAKPELAGRKCKCNGCSRVNTVPGEVGAVDFDDASENIETVPVEPSTDAAPVQQAAVTVGKAHRDGEFFRGLKMLVAVLVMIALVTCIFGLIFHAKMDITVAKPIPGMSDERVYNYVKAQEQTAGIVANGVGCLVCIGILFLLKENSNQPL